jgi:hypothetical protein
MEPTTRVSKPSLGKYLRRATAMRSWRLELEVMRERARRPISQKGHPRSVPCRAAVGGGGSAICKLTSERRQTNGRPDAATRWVGRRGRTKVAGAAERGSGPAPPKDRTVREGNPERHVYTNPRIGRMGQTRKVLRCQDFRNLRPLLPGVTSATSQSSLSREFWPRVSAILFYRWLLPRQAPQAERTHDPLAPPLTGGTPWADLSSIPDPTIQIP